LYAIYMYKRLPFLRDLCNALKNIINRAWILISKNNNYEYERQYYYLLLCVQNNRTKTKLNIVTIIIYYAII